jgi:hypothetical protein
MRRIAPGRKHLEGMDMVKINQKDLRGTNKVHLTRRTVPGRNHLEGMDMVKINQKDLKTRETDLLTKATLVSTVKKPLLT